MKSGWPYILLSSFLWQCFDTQNHLRKLKQLKCQGKVKKKNAIYIYIPVTRNKSDNITSCYFFHWPRYMFARMLKLKAKDADKIVLLHEVVEGFEPFLQPGEGHDDKAEKRARIG